MKEPLTPTQLRANLYRILDEVLETGEPREITRGGQRLRIVRVPTTKRDLDKIPKRDTLLCSPEELVNTHWDYEPDEAPFGDVS